MCGSRKNEVNNSEKSTLQKLCCACGCAPTSISVPKCMGALSSRSKKSETSKKLVQETIGFGSVVILKNEDSQLLARYKEVLRESYEVNENGKTCLKLSRARHVNEPQER